MEGNGLLAVLGVVGVGALAIFAGTEAKKKGIPLSKQISNMVNDGCLLLSSEVAEKYTDDQLKEAYRNTDNNKIRSVLRNEMEDRRLI